jgi:hypothetical protein
MVIYRFILWKGSSSSGPGVMCTGTVTPPLRAVTTLIPLAELVSNLSKQIPFVSS